jgi:aryl-alcohol dehydrogenase-like predicted oxidoreductase
VRPVADLRVEYALISRAVEADVLPALRELGIGLTAYGVLGRGLISGHWSAGHAAGPGESAASVRGSPAGMWSTTSLSWRLCAGSPGRRVAEARGRTIAQLAIAWVAAQGEDIVPLVGARTRERLAEALPAMGLNLSTDDLAEIEKAVPPGAATGTRPRSCLASAWGTEPHSPTSPLRRPTAWTASVTASVRGGG